ncbi:MAG: PD40 domain-containing protein [Chloroflexi bacterium]|nr:PD40 domain-containing protein [Chloroflexota bacterium]
MKPFFLVAVLVAILAMGCSVADELSTRLPSNDSPANDSTANDAASNDATGNESNGTPSGSTGGSEASPTTQGTEATEQPKLIEVIGSEPRRLTRDYGADQDPAWDPRGNIIAFMTSKPGELGRPYEIGGVSPLGTTPWTMAEGPRFDIGIAGELAWVGETGKLMTNERISIHEYMTFDTERSPFVRTVSDHNDDAFTRNLVIPGGQGGDGLAVSGDGETVMWMIRTSHDPKSYEVTVRLAELEGLTGQSANDAGTALVTHSAKTQGPDFNRGFSLTREAENFVVSLKNGEGFDLFLMDSSNGAEIRQLTTSGLSFGEHNLYPAISPDDQWVAYSSQSGVDGRPDLFVINMDGTGRAKVTDTSDVSEMRPSWSPDGLAMAYQGQDFSDDNPNWDIYVIDVFGSSSGTAVTTDPAAQAQPAADTAPAVGSLTVEHVRSWGESGNENGQFNAPRGIAIDKNYNIYVIDSGKHDLQTFSSAGLFLSQSGGYTNSKAQGRFMAPSGVAVDPLGNLYVADTGTARVQSFTTHEEFANRWQVDLDPVVNPFIQNPVVGPNENYPTQALAIGPNGNVFVAVGGVNARSANVQTFTSAGVPIGMWGESGEGDGQFKSPRGIAVDHNGNVYVADELNHRVLKFSTQGQFFYQIGASQGGKPVSGDGDGEFNAPTSVAVDSEGRVYVSEWGNHRVQVFSPTGEFIGKWGTKGSDDGQFLSPFGLAADDTDHVYVVDANNHRIQKFLVTFGP